MPSALLRVAAAIAGVGITLAGCSGDDLLGSESSEVGSERSWKLPTEVLAAGRQVRLTYDAAPLWRGAAACSGGLRGGARDLGIYLRDRFAGIDTVGGYACRRNTADTKRMSVHGTGRALDLMIPTRAGRADSTRGDAIANYLVTNADRIGVQLIIWNNTVWRANGTNAGPYGGPHPHDDHIHVEITNKGARRETAWFAMMDDGGLEDAEVADASIGDDDAEAAPDAAIDRYEPAPVPDAGSAPPDAGAFDAGTPIDDDDPDAGAVDDDPDPGKGQEGSEGEKADPGGPAGGYDFEVPEGEPATDDALGPRSKRRTQTYDDEELESAGCAAAPGGASGGGLAIGAFVALGAIAGTRRRKRR